MVFFSDAAMSAERVYLFKFYVFTSYEVEWPRVRSMYAVDTIRQPARVISGCHLAASYKAWVPRPIVGGGPVGVERCFRAFRAGETGGPVPPDQTSVDA